MLTKNLVAYLRAGPSLTLVTIEETPGGAHLPIGTKNYLCDMCIYFRTVAVEVLHWYYERTSKSNR